MISNNEKMVNFKIIIIIAMGLTASFDIFMVFPILGFNFRFTQILTLFLGCYWLIIIMKNKFIKIPLGSISLLIWILFIYITIPHTTFLLRNVGYAFWITLNVILIFSIVHFVNSKEKLILVFKWYIYSFLFVSLFGILQFILGILGFLPPFVTQWWVYGSLPRVNGFSYEPSYYATYLITGWVILSYLAFEGKIKIFSKKQIWIIYFIITISLILSSSRMGILIMGVWLLRYFFLFMKYLLKGKVNVKYFNILFTVAIIGIIMLLFLFGNKNNDFLLNGTGLGNTASHSVDAREKNLVNTFRVFLENPIYGVSLGGIAPAIADFYNVSIQTQEEAKNYEGQSVFVEALAASGIIGIIPFVIFILTIILKPIKLSNLIKDNQLQSLLRSLVFSLIILFVILQFNQNILRPYLWFHIAILCSSYSVIKKEKLWTNE